MDCIRKSSHQWIKACAYSTQHFIGQHNMIGGLEVAERGEVTGLPVPGRFREKYCIYKGLYNDRKGSGL